MNMMMNDMINQCSGLNVQETMRIININELLMNDMPNWVK